MMSVTMHTLDRRQDLERLLPRWRALVGAGSPNPAARPEWLLPWFEHMAGRQRLRVLAFEDHAGQLVGLVPLIGRGASWRLASDSHTPEAPVALAAGFERPVAATLHCTVRESGWRLELNDLPVTSSLGQAGWKLRMAAAPQDHVTWVGGSFAAFCASRSRGFRKSLRRAERGGRERGVEIELVSEPGRLAAVLPELAAVSRASWQGRAGTGTFASPAAALYEDVAARFARAGDLLLHIARADGEPVGFSLSVAHRHRVDVLQSEYVSSERSLRPGWLLAARLWQDAATRGARELHTGTWSTEFTRSWTTRMSPRCHVAVGRATAGAATRELVRRARSWTRGQVAAVEPRRAAVG